MASNFSEVLRELIGHRTPNACRSPALRAFTGAIKAHEFLGGPGSPAILHTAFFCKAFNGRQALNDCNMTLVRKE